MKLNQNIWQECDNNDDGEAENIKRTIWDIMCDM